MTRVPIIQTQAYADNGNPYTKTRAARTAGSVGLGAIAYAASTKTYSSREFRKDFVSNLTANGKYYSADEIADHLKRAVRTSKLITVMIYAGVGFLIGSLIDNNINTKRKSAAEEQKPVKNIRVL